MSERPWIRVLRMLWGAVRQRPLPLLADALLAVGQGVLAGVAVAALGHLIDRRTPAALLLWGTALAGGQAMARLRPPITRRAQQGLREALGDALLDAAARFPLEDFERRAVRSRLDRASDVFGGDRLYNLLQVGLTLLTQASSAVSVGVVLAHLSPWLALPAGVSIAVQAWADTVRVRWRFRLDARGRGRQRFLGYLGDLLRDPAVNAEARLFGGARWLIGRWRREWERLQRAEADLSRRELGRDALVRGSALAVYLGAFAYAVLLARQGALTAGGVVALAAGVRALQDAAEEISYQVADGQDHWLRLADAAAILDRARGRSGTGVPLAAAEVIRVRDVRYRYPEARRDALRGVSLELRRGRLLALVGENGSGKTTLTRVLLGLLTPAAGTVDGDGGGVLRRAAVLQDFARYDLSLRENVGLGRPSAMHQDAELRDALAQGGAATEVAARSGLDALLGSGFEGARDLSGGQWQAVATARGVFARGDLLVLDEPTAALDPLAERDVFERFAALARGRFAVIVTHRMGAAALAEEVAVLHRGRVVEYGTHAALVAAGGRYARMWEAQARWYR